MVESSDLLELNYAGIASELGCTGIRVEDPEQFAPALAQGLADTTRPMVIDIIVTRDPARMLPAADARTLKLVKGDRPV
jgi:acetolactate synthase-1/2/3 large subunit